MRFGKPPCNTAQCFAVADSTGRIEQQEVVHEFTWLTAEPRGAEYCVVDSEPVPEPLSIGVADDDVGALGAVLHIAEPGFDIPGGSDDAPAQFGRQVLDDALLGQPPHPRRREDNFYIGIWLQKLGEYGRELQQRTAGIECYFFIFVDVSIANVERCVKSSGTPEY